MPLVPDLIYGPNLIAPRYLPKNKKARPILSFEPLFKTFYHITPAIKETFGSYLVLKIIAQNKGKGVYQERKKPREIGTIQGDVWSE